MTSPLTHLELLFPKLKIAGYNKTSEQTGQPLDDGAYNCIAWAAEDTNHGYWWPDGGFWPNWLKGLPTVPRFIRAFNLLGYFVTHSSRREFAFDKVALFALHKSFCPTQIPIDLDDFGDWAPTHMARQLSDEKWTSKCGGYEDIAHYTLDAVESYYNRDAYGCPVVYMKRFILVSWVVRMIQGLIWKIERSQWKSKVKKWLAISVL